VISRKFLSNLKFTLLSGNIHSPKKQKKMDEAITVTIISVSGSIVIAALTFYLTKRHELSVQWRNEKINHYKVLFSALSDLAVDGTDKDEANMRFALAVNTIALVSPQYVISALMAFHDEVKFSNPNKSPEKHDKLLNELLLSVRKDIGLASGDDPDTFCFHLIGTAPIKAKGNLPRNGREYP
jgi:hypothetical protein